MDPDKLFTKSFPDKAVQTLIQDIIRIFKFLDKKCVGYLSKSEMNDFFYYMGLNELVDKFPQIIKEMNKDRNDEIKVDYIVDVFRSKLGYEFREEDIKESLETFMEPGERKLASSELERALPAYSDLDEKQVMDLINIADPTHSKYIDVQNLVNLLFSK